jgi:hypothetical protein
VVAEEGFGPAARCGDKTFFFQLRGYRAGTPNPSVVTVDTGILNRDFRN